MITDKQGNNYYSVEEAMQELNVKRSTFQKMAEKLTKYRREHDRRHYYRVEEVQAMKNQPGEMWAVQEVKKGRAA